MNANNGQLGSKARVRQAVRSLTRKQKGAPDPKANWIARHLAASQRATTTGANEPPKMTTNSRVHNRLYYEV